MYFTARKILLGLSVAPISLGLMAGAHAQQSLNDINQGIRPKPARQVSIQPKDVTGAPSDKTQLLASLSGVAILNSPHGVNAGGTKVTGGVESRGDVVPDAVLAAAKKYVGQEVSLDSLDRMTRDMVLAYRASGIPVVNVVIPPQDITNGNVQIIAVVGRVGEVSIAGDAEDLDYYGEGFPLKSGEVVSEGAMLDHLRWKSRRFHRRLDAVYSPGAGFSDTDITLEARETKPWTVFLGVDNTGSRNGGDYRFFTGFTAGDLWNKDHELSYQTTTSDKGLKGLFAHVLTYTMPVEFMPRADFQIMGSFSETESEANNVVTSGVSKQISAKFIKQLPRLGGYFSSDLHFGVDYKHNNTDNLGVSSRTTEITQLFFNVVGQMSDAKSSTDLNFGLWLSPGLALSHGGREAYNEVREGASPTYGVFRAGIDHTIYLANDFRLNADIDVQLASARLLPSEMMYLGGLDSVRGFDESSARGDSGVRGRLEIQGPAWSIKQGDSFRLYGFTDFGSVAVSGTPATGEVERTDIASSGVGVTYQYEDGFTAEAAVGMPWEKDALEGVDNAMLHFRMLKRY